MMKFGRLSDLTRLSHERASAVAVHSSAPLGSVRPNPDQTARQRLQTTIFPFGLWPNSSRVKIAVFHRPLLRCGPSDAGPVHGSDFFSRTEGNTPDEPETPRRFETGVSIMSHIAEFKIIGRVGAIKDVGSTLRVSIASTYSRKDARGDWLDKSNWNEITIFNDATQGYVRRNISVGDLVYTDGALSQNSYEKDGQRVYQVTLACERIDRLVKAEGKPDAADEKPAGRAAELVDDNVPF
jgi:single-stranded DNA-binding protein